MLVGIVATFLLSGLLFFIVASQRGDPVFRLLIALGKYRALTLDAESVAADMRKFAREVRWDKPPAANRAISVRHDSPDFPKELRRTKASAIIVRDDRVELEFGGTFIHFGIVVFREGDGHGLKRLAGGVWFYSEDGKASIF